jgi:hypothetical protein
MGGMEMKNINDKNKDPDIRDQIISRMPFKLEVMHQCQCKRQPTETDIFRGAVMGKVDENGVKSLMVDDNGFTIELCLTCRTELYEERYKTIRETAGLRIEWDKHRRKICNRSEGEPLTARQVADTPFPGVATREDLHRSMGVL